MTPRQPKLCYVITDLQRGGVPLHVRRLALAMRARGYECEVVSLGGAGDVFVMLKDDGFDVHQCDGRHGADWRVMNRLIRHIRMSRPDVIHSMLFHANIACRAAVECAGIGSNRLICEIQTVERERRWHLWVDRWTHRGCRWTVGNSPSVVQHLATNARLSPDRLRLVRGGIDATRFDGVRPLDPRSLGVPAGAPLVGWVGRLDPVKGIDKLIEAFSNCAAVTDARLVLVGDGPLESTLKAQVRDRGLSSRVHFVPARDDIPELLAGLNLFAFPSMTEGLPNALLEAMACGLPIVTTDVSGCRDLIEPNRSGLVVPFGDVPALSNALTRLLNDRALADRLGAAAKQAVAAHWGIEAMFEAYNSLYVEVLAETRVDRATS